MILYQSNTQLTILKLSPAFPCNNDSKYFYKTSRNTIYIKLKISCHQFPDHFHLNSNIGYCILSAPYSANGDFECCQVGIYNKKSNLAGLPLLVSLSPLAE